MKIILTAVMAVYFCLIMVSTGQDRFLDNFEVNIKNSTFDYPTGGAIEHTKTMLYSIGVDPSHWMIVMKPSIKQRVFGSCSPLSWCNYVSQDAKSSWSEKIGYLGGLS